MTWFTPEVIDVFISVLKAVVILLGLGVWAWHELYGRWSESTSSITSFICSSTCRLSNLNTVIPRPCR